ncbi:unnamed protein product [Cuscuta campestris]|uniref:G protein gamma domain-containing protein n=1 Tax=Cuscuta campestris TaxID=132261 RepID=A0A484NR12_9ASTE|nr:unnamed protein product [Cuscuta campestris]
MLLGILESSGSLEKQTRSEGGKHAISAELKRSEQEARFLEEELEQLVTMGNASAACNELLLNMETRPDPLLPLTNGPTSPSWDLWFEGVPDKSPCGCCIV